MPVVLEVMGPMNSRFDVATELWAGAVVANGGTVSIGRKTLVDNLVRSLKTAALFSKLDRLSLYVAENEASALTDIITRRLSTNVSGTTFTVDGGYTGDGASSYINTNYNLVSDAVNYSLNSAHHSLWMLSATEAAGVNVNFDGVYDGTNLTDMITGISPQVIGRVNSPSEDIPGNGTDGYRGHWLANRSSATDGQLYLNGVQVGTNNALSAGGVPAFNMFVFARNNFGSPALFTAGPIGCFSAGASFNATEAAAFSGILRAYMAAVGVQL